MSLQDHVNQSNADPTKKARHALLNAIADEVGKIEPDNHQDVRSARLKALAETYALVVHGTK